MNPKKITLLFILPLIIFTGFALFLFTRLGTSTTIEVNTSVNKVVPSFNLPNLMDTNELLTEADLPNKPYLMNVWGSWCIACSREHPFLLKMKQQGINIVGINYKDDTKYAASFLQEEGNPYSLSIADEEGGLGIDLGLTGAPETFVVDDKGTIRQHIVGEINLEIWQSRIEPCWTAIKDDNFDEIEHVCQ